MSKVDYKKALKHLYNPSAKKVEIVTVPPMNFLMIDGAGDPGTSQSFQDAIEALFAVSYALKFMVKKGEIDIDYGVMPLEGLWWADDMSAFTVADKARWQWTLMIMQPDFVTDGLVAEAIEQVRKKKNPAALGLLRYETFAEGRAAQTMHVGPFADEGPTVARVHAFIADEGHRRAGKHHEIYLSDIRRADPAKWKTVIRQPLL